MAAAGGELKAPLSFATTQKVGEGGTPFPGQLRPLTSACWYSFINLRRMKGWVELSFMAGNRTCASQIQYYPPHHDTVVVVILVIVVAYRANNLLVYLPIQFLCFPLYPWHQQQTVLASMKKEFNIYLLFQTTNMFIAQKRLDLLIGSLTTVERQGRIQSFFGDTVLLNPK